VDDDEAETELAGEPCGYTQPNAGTFGAVDPADNRALNLLSVAPSHEDRVADVRSNAY
jgi:hypothetical protein